MHSPTTHDDPGQPSSLARRLSCLLDGDTQQLSAEEACKAWRDDPEYRAAWHRWHFIGDVMRSGELASPPGRDAAFLARVRERLAAEPPLLAPSRPRANPATQRRRAWMAPAAVAAGFVAVAGVVVAVRMNDPVAAPDAALASSAGASGALVGALQASAAMRSGAQSNALMRASTQGGAGVAATAPSDAAMLRDAEIDHYFRAHRGAAASPAMPGGAPRNVDTIVQR